MKLYMFVKIRTFYSLFTDKKVKVENESVVECTSFCDLHIMTSSFVYI